MKRFSLLIALAACAALSCDRAPLGPDTPSAKREAAQAQADTLYCGRHTNVVILGQRPLEPAQATAATEPVQGDTDGDACPDYCDDTSGCLDQGMGWRCGRRPDGTCGSICE